MCLDNSSSIKVTPVTILMATRNGAKFLPEQLQSISDQQDCTWTLIASDDGSEDSSREVIARFAGGQGERVVLLTGPRQGVTANFRHLLAHAPDGAAIAYCDQDDIWSTNKLCRAMLALDEVPEDVPALYGSSVQPVDASGRQLLGSPLPVPLRPLTLRNALVQNVFPGNTIVANPAAVDLLKNADSRLIAAGMDYVLHDWWAYILVSAAGGKLIFDTVPSVLYRQHRANLIGSKADWKASILRVLALIAGRNAAWLDRHLRALTCLDDLLTPSSRQLVSQVQSLRSKGFLTRSVGLWKADLYGQSRRAQLGFCFAISVGLI